MEIIKKQEQYMKFICQKYDKDDTFRQYGEYPWSLISESGIDFGDAGAQLAAMELLQSKGDFKKYLGQGEILAEVEFVRTIELGPQWRAFFMYKKARNLL